jgi:hypothetical protein
MLLPPGKKNIFIFREPRSQCTIGQNYLFSYWPWQQALASYWLDELANSSPAHTHYLTAVGHSYAASDLVTQFFKSEKFSSAKFAWHMKKRCGQ